MARRRPIVWTDPALDAMDDIAAWIALDGQPAAARLVTRVLKTVERLRTMPNSGRHVPELPKGRYREIIVPPVRVIYRLEGTSVLIVAVMRGEHSLEPQDLG